MGIAKNEIKTNKIIFSVTAATMRKIALNFIFHCILCGYEIRKIEEKYYFYYHGSYYLVDGDCMLCFIQGCYVCLL